MFRVDNSTSVAVEPTPSAAGTPGYFTDGDPTLGVQATLVPADWFNRVTDELMAIIVAAGIMPSKTNSAQVLAALRGMIQGNVTTYAPDTGTANAYAAAYSPEITALTDGMILEFQAAHANTGASTFSPNGLTAKPIIGGAHAALQGGEIVVDGTVLMAWNASLNSWILLDCTGGSPQVPTATQSLHGINLGQAQSMMFPAIQQYVFGQF